MEYLKKFINMVARLPGVEVSAGRAAIRDLSELQSSLEGLDSGQELAEDHLAALELRLGRMEQRKGIGPALDVSLEQARTLHRVWRALNDGDCPKCHRLSDATAIQREWRQEPDSVLKTGLRCPNCDFSVEGQEIVDIEEMFAPAMDAAVEIFEAWRMERVLDSLEESCEIEEGVEAATVEADLDRVHLVKLSNGRTIAIEERSHGGLHIAHWEDGEVVTYICTLSADGVMVMPNSGDATQYLTEGI